MSRQTYAACTVPLTSTGNTIQLLPAGQFRTKDGRPAEVAAWTLDATSAATLIDSSPRTNRIVIDYEHQTLNALANGKPAPAAGWFSAMEWREGDGLYATDVEWTDKARQMIQSGEYRYISPVIAYDKETGVVTRLMSAGLTNDPAIEGMEEVAALSDVRSHPRDERSHKSEDVAALVRTSNELLAALKAKTAEADQSKAELVALRNQIEGDRLEGLIEQALSDARLLPVHVEAARKLGQADFAALRTLLDRPPLVPALLGSQTERLRKTGWTPEASSKQAALTAEELHVCALAGRAPQEYAALKRRFDSEDTGFTD